MDKDKRRGERTLKRRVGIVRDLWMDLNRASQIEWDATDSQWQSLGEDPQCRVRCGRPWVGWHMLELGMHHDRAEARARLYVDYGTGFSEVDSFPLTVKAGEVAKRVVYFPRRPRALRFDPLESPGRFSIDRLRLVWLLPWFARHCIATRLVGLHPDWQQADKSVVMPQLKEQARTRGTSTGRYAIARYDETFQRLNAHDDYAAWRALQATPSVSELKQRAAEVSRALEALDTGSVGTDEAPLFSVLVPVYDPEPTWLRACLDSVIAQSFTDWELCVANDASPNPAIPAILDAYAANDPRIRVTHRPENGHIARASNTALESASGRFIALLDHDDCLSPDALLVMAEAIVEDPARALLYSDEDKIAASGERFDPHFKPDWNPDLAHAQNYVSHLGVYRRERVLAVGGFRAGFEGSQDHDLLLRFTEWLPREAIHHVRQVLYHWRATEGSTALSADGKDYAAAAGQRAVADRMAAIEPAATVEAGRAPHSYRVRWPRPEPAPRVSLIIPTRDGVDILKPCVNAILERTDYPDYEVLIVDNESRCPRTLDYLASLSALSQVRVIEWHEPFNYSAINNYAVNHADGEVIGLINNDIEPINNDWLDEMVRQAMRPAIGCVGAKLYYPNERIQHAGVILGLGGVAGHSHKHFPRTHPGYFYRLQLVQNLSAVTAACLVMRRSIFDAVGGLDAVNLPVAFNDVDLCLRVREAGYWNLWTPYAEAYHHESVSRGGEDTPEKRARAAQEIDYMRRRWRHWLDDDPAYNPNLTRNAEDFSLTPYG